jgi:hypothetical protein
MNNTCYPKEQILQELTFFYLQFIYLDHYVDPQDYDNPFKLIFGADLLQGSSYSGRSDNYFFKKVNIETDSGFLLSDINEKQSFQLDSKTNFVIANNPSFIFQQIITLNNLVDVYKRKYIKIQTIMANTGGFISFALELLRFLNALFANSLFYQYIYFNLLERFSMFKNKNDDDLLQNKTKNNYGKVEILRVNHSSANTITIHNNISNLINTGSIVTHNKTQLQESVNYVINSNQSVTAHQFSKYGLTDILCKLFKRDRIKRDKIITKVENYISTNLDVENLMLLSERIKTSDHLIFGEEIGGIKNMIMLRKLLSSLSDENMHSEKGSKVSENLEKLFSRNDFQFNIYESVKKELLKK